MDIRNWPVDRIMQLPDCCFGQRTEHIFSYDSMGGLPRILFGRCALPDVCVIWELYCNNWHRIRADLYEGVDIDIRLGDFLPIGTAQFNTLEPVFKCRTVDPQSEDSFQGRVHLTRLRKVIFPQGRRFVTMFDDVTDCSQTQIVALVVSSIPTEVPDWLISGPGRSL